MPPTPTPTPPLIPPQPPKHLGGRLQGRVRLAKGETDEGPPAVVGGVGVSGSSSRGRRSSGGGGCVSVVAEGRERGLVRLGVKGAGGDGDEAVFLGDPILVDVLWCVGACLV